MWLFRRIAELGLQLSVFVARKRLLTAAEAQIPGPHESSAAVKNGMSELIFFTKIRLFLRKILLSSCRRLLLSRNYCSSWDINELCVGGFTGAPLFSWSKPPGLRIRAGNFDGSYRPDAS
jgi:hypothetical protein